MTPPDIPPHVLTFVAEHIDTVPQLEALLLLREDEQRSWTVEELAARIYVPADAAREILRALEQRRFIVGEEKPPRYRYSPDRSELREQVSLVAVEYQRHLVPIATVIHSKASASVRAFARAFDLKKDR
jgi:predicted transcriptional regulator